MGDAGAWGARPPAVYSIPGHRSFADALAAGLIRRLGNAPDALARGRVLLPNNRAVRTLTEAFVRASGSGLLLPRLIPIGDPELDDRIGGALDPADPSEPIPPAIDPLQRRIVLASLVRRQPGPPVGAAEAMRLAADLARTLDALLIEDVDPQRLATAAEDAPELAAHWQVSLERLRAILDQWPLELARLGRIDLADRRNRLLRATATRWSEAPPVGFTVAAGITTTAPAIAELVGRIARLPEGMVVLPALAPEAAMDAGEWDSLGPDDRGRGEETHPQYHLKLLLERIGVARGEVLPWRAGGRAASPAVRGRAIANAMTAANFSDRWNALPPRERRLTGIRSIELADPAAEAQAIAIALRAALETPARTAALVTPDRVLAGRVSALLERWGIAADDSAGRPLSQRPPGSLLLAIAAAAVEDFAPVALIGLVKHPLVAAGEGRVAWLDSARALDLALRGPRPPGGIGALDEHVAAKAADERFSARAIIRAAWAQMRPPLAEIARAFRSAGTLTTLAAALRESATLLAGDAAWSGADGRLAAELLATLEAAPGAAALAVTPEDIGPLLRQLLDEVPVRPPFGGHPRIFIWGLLEARLQQADLMILGGLNEGVWPSLPSPDPWLAPRIRANLNLPGLDFRTGLAAHDFASALGAPRVLLTRARRDSRSPTVASRFWLRLMAMTGGLARDVPLQRWAAGIDDPRDYAPTGRPAPRPPLADRPTRIAVTSLDRLQADPFSFYAQAMLRLRRLDPVDADHTAAWRGTAVHRVLELWFAEDDCDADRLLPRARELLAGDAIHPMLRAMWQPRLLEAIDWIAARVREDRLDGRLPLAAEVAGETEIGGVTLHGKADRIDRIGAEGLAIVDYKTGKPPSTAAVREGFALQLGLLGLIARAGGFEGIAGEPLAHEYWSLARDSKGRFGHRKSADAELGPAAFLAHAEGNFLAAAARWLTGDEGFTAKLRPAYAPYGDYDQLMRFEEWYGRD